MKNKLFLTICALQLVIPQALPGEMDSGGGYLESVKDMSAWFVDPQREIKVCFKWSEGFGASEQSVHEEIQNSFQTWVNYLEKKKSSRRGAPPHAKKLLLLEQCSGEEDLTLFLGLENDLIKSTKKKFEKPFALSIRTHFDPKARWGKGLIWLTHPSQFEHIPTSGWGLSNRLYSVLLHEWGHVFGVPHINGTIMDPFFGNLMHHDENIQTRKRIDQNSELITADDVETTYTEDFKRGRESNKKIEAIFQRFMGRNPKGTIQQDVVVRWHNQNQVDSIHLVLRDEQGEKKFLFQEKEDSYSTQLFNIQFFTFRAYYESFNNETGTWSEESFNRYHLSTIRFGHFKDAQGKDLAVVFRHNSGTAPVHLDVLEGSEQYRISVYLQD